MSVHEVPQLNFSQETPDNNEKKVVVAQNKGDRHLTSLDLRWSKLKYPHTFTSDLLNVCWEKILRKRENKL